MKMTKVVSIVMGSESDRSIMEKSAQILAEFGVGWEMRVLSAHRTPEEVREFALAARERGVAVIIAGAGGAAHLPGVIAAYTTLPVIGVPIGSSPLGGWDALLAIVQMPAGIPVATVGVNAAANAALLSVGIMAESAPGLAEKLEAYRAKRREEALAADRRAREAGREAGGS